MSAKILRTPNRPLTQIELKQLNALKRQKYVSPWPYYSKVKFRAARVTAAPGPYTYTIPRGEEVVAFSYALTGNREAAGFTLFDGAATRADTNLTKPQETTSGEIVQIHGIAIQPLSHCGDVKAAGDPVEQRPCDHSLLGAIAEGVSWQLDLNGGQNALKMGTLTMIGGAGGLSGGAESPLDVQPIAGGNTSKPYPNNGWPVGSHYLHIPEGQTWNRSGGADSMLAIVGRVERDIILVSGNDPDVPAVDVAAAAGVQAKNYPEVIAVTLMVHLKGSVLGIRGTSQ